MAARQCNTRAGARQPSSGGFVPCIDANTTITLICTLSMIAGKEMLIVVREGTVTGAQLAGKICLVR